MKKKILSAILAVCMLVTVFTSSVVVMADDAFAYDVNVKAEGKLITVTITMPGEANAAGGNFTFQYDNEKLAFKETVENSSSAIVNPNYTENSVRASIASGVFPFTKDTVMWKFTMDYKSGTLSSNDFAITAFRIYDENSELIGSNDTAETKIDFSCNHLETKEEVTLEPTHTEEGTNSVVCVVCGEIINSSPISATGHTFGEWKETKAPTCTEPGEETRECSCGEIETRKIPAKGHTPSEWNVSVAPTCTEPGQKKAICLDCGVEFTEEISATGHISSGIWEVIKAPTCTDSGTEVEKCSACGTVIDERTIPATGHTFGEWKQTKAPTCTEPGEETRKCACGETETREVPAKGHTPGEWNVTLKPTCTNSGEKKSICKDCGMEFLEEIPATGHTAGEWTVIKDATCTTDGERKTICTVCGEEYTEVIPAKGHQFGEWVVLKEATETEEGLRERVCSVCGEKESEIVPVLKTETSDNDENVSEIEQNSSNVTENTDSSLKSPKTGSDLTIIGAVLMMIFTLSTIAIVIIRHKRTV